MNGMNGMASLSDLNPLDSLESEYGLKIPVDLGHIEPIENFNQRQCDRYNERQGYLKGYPCDKCRNKGYISYLNNGGYEVMRECDCMKIRRNLLEMESIGLGKEIEKCSFDSFRTDHPFQKRVLDYATDFVNDKSETWFWIAGQSGSGKTHICTAVCSKLIYHGRSVKYLLWKDLLHRLESNRFDDAGYQAIINEVRNADVLYIDDFLKTSYSDTGIPLKPESGQLSYAYEIINARCIVRKKTILSSEHLLQELESYDTALAGRIRQCSGKYTANISRVQDRNFRLNSN